MPPRDYIDPNWVNTTDAARLAGVTHKTIAVWVRKGWLPVRGRGKQGRAYFHPDEVWAAEMYARQRRRARPHQPRIHVDRP